ncbi:MAG TPA: thiamine pyrophosphate-dependent enzyme [Methylomirabilota bacterium]|nr:thiamine pyrophosphate-dependent enzyme [Methylomirabilota bacterium]
MPISGKEFIEAAESEGHDFFTGVPCSLVGDAIAALETHPRLPYVPAVREDVAVGMAAGAWLAGRAPFVIMQNSGLGTSLNAVVSLSLMYRLPAVLLVTWRGHGGKDAPEHLVMGDISPRLLDLMGVPHRVLSADTAPTDIAWARAESTRLSQPVALLLPPGVMATRSHAETGHGGPQNTSRTGGSNAGGGRAGAISGPPLMVDRNPAQSVVPTGDLTPKISRLEALRAAMGAVGDAPVVHANGFICRESFSLGDRPQNFYMIGSMGLASAIGLGVALARPERPAVVFDGDGNLLMNLGILPMIGGGPLMGAGRPANFVHVVFDNAVYGSTGNQASPSRHARLDAIAAASGYRSAVAVAGGPEVREAVAAALREGGPAFVLVKVTAEEQPAPRIPYPPEEIRDRFRGALAGATAGHR